MSIKFDIIILILHNYTKEKRRNTYKQTKQNSELHTWHVLGKSSLLQRRNIHRQYFDPKKKKQRNYLFAAEGVIIETERFIDEY